MKRLGSVFLVLCMMLSCVAFGETLDGAQGEIMNEVSDVASDEVQTPDEPTQAPVNEDDIVLPDMDDDISILPSDDVNGPDPYRETIEKAWCCSSRRTSSARRCPKRACASAGVLSPLRRSTTCTAS